MAKVRYLLVLSYLLLALTGCVTSETLIKLNADGSGLVVQTTLMNTETIAQLTAMMQGMARQIAGPQAKQDAPAMPELFSEKEARSQATRFGPGVSYVSSRKIKTDRQEGIEATYSFRDITKLKLSEKPNPPAVPGLPDSSAEPTGETTFRFARLTGGNSLLTAVFSSRPPSKDKVSSSLPAVPHQPAQQATREQIEQVKTLFQGLRIGMAIEVQGSIVRTNSLYQEGTKVTLLEMDFGELLSNEALLHELAGKKGQSMTLDDAKLLLKGLKGFKVNLEPEVTIEFAGK